MTQAITDAGRQCEGGVGASSAVLGQTMESFLEQNTET